MLKIMLVTLLSCQFMDPLKSNILAFLFNFPFFLSDVRIVFEAQNKEKLPKLFYQGLTRTNFPCPLDFDFIPSLFVFPDFILIEKEKISAGTWNVHYAYVSTAGCPILLIHMVGIISRYLPPFSKKSGWWRVADGRWQWWVKKKFLGRKILSVMKLQGEIWRVWWVASDPIPFGLISTRSIDPSS